MNEVVTIVVWTLIAGIAMPIGATLAAIERIKPAWLEEEFRHFISALGGGVLLSAISLVLIPEGVIHLNIPSVIGCFLFGGLFFLALDVILVRSKYPSSQAVAMLADFLPEAVALGALLISAPLVAPLLAAMIFFQNLPEGFNAYRELVVSTNHRPRKIILSFILLSLIGPIAGLIGYYYLSSHEVILSALMVFSGGGILYLIFQDIAPQAKLEKHWAPPLGALLGFLFGVVAKIIVHGG